MRPHGTYPVTVIRRWWAAAGRLWVWWRRRKPLVNLAFVSPLLVLVVVSMPDFSVHHPLSAFYRVDDLYFLTLNLVLTVPLIWRRTWPRAVFGFIALVAFCQWVAQVPIVPGDITVLIALYTVAAECTFRWGVAAALVTQFGAVLEVRQEWDSWKSQKAPLLFLTCLVAGIWILGIHINTRRAYLHSLEEKAARLERERDTQVQIAMAAERARIARELHDVVAHNVSVIVVQADGATYAIDTDAERAKRALETISLTGRQALSEMRRLLGVLREGDDAGPYAPQPGLDQLSELVEHVRESGLPLEFEVSGEPRPVSAGLQLTMFRIVQEALTNTLKHGGAEATALVRLRYGPDAVEIVIADDGRGAAAPNDGDGHGLVGMRERASMYGGTAEAAPLPGGGFQVVARLPLREGAKA